MPETVSNVLEQFISEVRELLGSHFNKAILYGSYARGDYHENSDVDIMILTDLNEKEIEEYRVKIRELACDLELDNDIIISPLLRNINKYNERVNVVPFYMNVQKEGVVING